MEIIHNSRPNIAIKKVAGDAASPHQKTFNRLIKKVQDLQKQQDKVACELDEALQFYYATVHPDELVLLQHLIERINIAYAFYKTAKGFSKNELEIFKSWLKDQVAQVCSMHKDNNLPTTIKDIFKDLHGAGYDDCFAQEVEDFKENFQEYFKDFFDEDIDLSDVDFAGSQEDITRNIFMKIGKTASALQEKSRQAPKTKKQIEKASKAQALAQIQTKSLHSIYKRLARVLHPDLEQDIEKRILKEELMKQLTVAYKKEDLYALLKIETEWMNHSVDKMHSHDDNEIKIYNAILKDQIKELEMTNNMLLMHPRYMSIQGFYRYGFNGLSTLQQQHTALKQLIQEVQDMVSLLKTSQIKTIFKKIIKNQTMVAKGICTCGNC